MEDNINNGLLLGAGEIYSWQINKVRDDIMDEKQIRVHAHHCCKKHGCKYGNDNCPVAYGDVEQVYPCWDCYDEEE